MEYVHAYYYEGTVDHFTTGKYNKTDLCVFMYAQL